MRFLADSWYLFLRQVVATRRMPVFLLISIVQPILWLLLFGQLFRSVTAIPGFESGSYVQFLAPGVTIMTAIFSSAYAGMSLLGDVERGVLDRMLSTPVARGSLIVGRLLYAAVQVVLQALVILAVAFALGARPRGGLPGVLVLLLAASLLSAAFAGFSSALALLTRRQEIIIAASNFTVTPMIFSSSMLMSHGLMPGWLETVARFNPVEWAVIAARNGYEGRAAGETALFLLLLAGFALACGALATRAFGRYRRSM